MEKIPKPTHGSIEWLTLRHRDANNKVVFGASDAPALMGASQYRSRAELFINKLEPPTASVDKPEFRRGNILEPVLLEQAGEFLKTKIFTPQVMYRNGRFSISLDGVDDTDNPSVIVEAKTTTRYAINSSDDLPLEWLWQGWCQQGVLSPNINKPIPVFFTVLDRNQQFSCFPMPTNIDAFALLTQEATTFGQWIETGQPSPEDIDNFSAEQIARIYKPTGTEVELGDRALELVFELDEARYAKKQADLRESAIRDEIAKLLLNHEIATFNGQKIISWKQQKGRAGVNLTLLKNEHPELIAHYETEGAPFRVLRTHKLGTKVSD